MTSAQTLMTSHSSFDAKQKPTLLSEDNEHEFSTSKAVSLSKYVSQPNTRTARTSLRAREQLDQGSLKGSMVATSENSRKSETSPQGMGDNVGQGKGKLIPSNLAAKLDQMPEENLLSGNDFGRARKLSEDNSTYNTRKWVKSTEQAMEIEDSRAQNEKKSTPVESLAGQQIGGYHLRSTGPKSGNRDLGFQDDFEYDYPGKNAAVVEGPSGINSSSRSRTSRGAGSANVENNQDAAAQKPGSGQKNATSRKIRQPNLQNMICDEDISQMGVSADASEKKRITRNKKDIEELNLKCTEELDPIELMQTTNPRSPPKAENRRRGGKKCLNKLCLTNPNIPSLWAKEKVKGSFICKACHDAFSKEQFCYFCHQIYVDDETTTAADDKDWIGCDSCGGWHHIQCEDAYGSKIISQHAKYYCPKCRQNKPAPRNNRVSMSLLEIPATASKGNSSPKNSHPSTPRKGGKNANTRPPLDDWLTCEEGLEEPVISKLRFNNDRRGTNVEVSVASGEEEQAIIEEEEEDVVKKKLDSLFRRSGGRRRIALLKPQINVESFGELDKLMIQFGSKKPQLSEQEIKSDLMRIRELTRGLNGLQLISEASGSEMCATEGGDLTEETESLCETKNTRSKIIKEEKNSKAMVGSEVLQKMSLRRR